MKELGKITKSKVVSIETKAKVIHTLVFTVTIYRFESWTVKKADRKKLIYLKFGIGGESTDTLDSQEDEQEGPRAKEA